MHRAQPPVVVLQKGEQPGFRSTANFGLEKFVDSSQVERHGTNLLDSFRNVFIVIELCMDITRIFFLALISRYVATVATVATTASASTAATTVAAASTRPCSITTTNATATASTRLCATTATNIAAATTNAAATAAATTSMHIISILTLIL